MYVVIFLYTVDMKILTKSTNKMIDGISAGIAEYFNKDIRLVRLVVTFVVLATGILPGIITYLIGMKIVPEKNEIEENK